MHELGITRNVVAIVAEHAQGRPVLRVTLDVGRLSGLLPDAIRFCFDLCSAGTLLQGAQLQIIETAGRGCCADCSAETLLDIPLGRCPACQGPNLRLVAGTDIRIKEMETGPCA
jgi:hydrogenase nickel incorporation protein HypA/HybF